MVQTIKVRQRNLEELRCLAMMMVIVLHFLGKGEVLGDVAAGQMSVAGIGAWVLEAFCIVAVNCYMLISGYFLCESSFKLSRLFKLYLQIWMYSAGAGMAAVVFGVVPAAEINTHYFLSLLFPISMGHYWFMTAYLFLYLLFPVVGMAVKRMSKSQMQLVLGMLLAVFCLFKSILPVKLEMDGQGYDFLWYLCVFLVAAYQRKYGWKLLDKHWKCVGLYVGSCAMCVTELFVLRAVYLRTGSLGLILKVSFEYNHIFVLLGAMGLFGCFLHVKGNGAVGSGALHVAPYVLGVYLLHENIGIRYSWPEIFHAKEIATLGQLLLYTAAAVVCVFAAGVVTEWIRSVVVKTAGRLLGHLKGWKKLMILLEKADGLFL